MNRRQMPKYDIGESLSVMGMDAGATPEQVKSAYRAKALMTHPDKGGKVAEFIKVKDAYDYLLRFGTGAKVVAPPPIEVPSGYGIWVVNYSYGVRTGSASGFVGFTTA